MSEMIGFLDGLMGEFAADLNTAMPARIESYDSQKLKAVVSPLFKRKFQGQDSAVSMPPIVEVPVSCLRAGGFIIRPPYKKGDIVLLVFAQRALDNVIGTGKEADPEITRMHALDDAIVVGGLMPFTGSLPAGYDSDLVIGTDDFKAKIVISSDGTINIESQEKPVSITAPKGITLSATDPAGSGVQINGKDNSGSW